MKGGGHKGQLSIHEAINLLHFHPTLSNSISLLTEGNFQTAIEELDTFLVDTHSKLKEILPLASSFKLKLKDLSDQIKHSRKRLKKLQRLLPDLEDREDLESFQRELADLFAEVVNISDKVSDILSDIVLHLEKLREEGGNPNLYILAIYLKTSGRDEYYRRIAASNFNILLDQAMSYERVLLESRILLEALERPLSSIAKGILRDFELALNGFKLSLKKLRELFQVLSEEELEPSELAEQLKKVYLEGKSNWEMLIAALRDLNSFTLRLMPIKLLDLRILALSLRRLLSRDEGLSEETINQLSEVIARRLANLRDIIYEVQQGISTLTLASIFLDRDELNSLLEKSEAINEGISELSEILDTLVFSLGEGGKNIDLQDFNVDDLFDLIREISDQITDLILEYEDLRERELRSVSALPPELKSLVKLVKRVITGKLPGSLIRLLLMSAYFNTVKLIIFLESVLVLKLADDYYNFYRNFRDNLAKQVIHLYNLLMVSESLERDSDRVEALSDYFQSFRDLLKEFKTGPGDRGDLASKAFSHLEEISEEFGETFKFRCPKCKAWNPVSSTKCYNCEMIFPPDALDSKYLKIGMPESLVPLATLLQLIDEGILPFEVIEPVFEDISYKLKIGADSDEKLLPILNLWSSLTSELKSGNLTRLEELWSELLSEATA